MVLIAPIRSPQKDLEALFVFGLIAEILAQNGAMVAFPARSPQESQSAGQRQDASGELRASDLVRWIPLSFTEGTILHIRDQTW